MTLIFYLFITNNLWLQLVKHGPCRTQYTKQIFQHTNASSLLPQLEPSTLLYCACADSLSILSKTRKIPSLIAHENFHFQRIYLSITHRHRESERLILPADMSKPRFWSSRYSWHKAQPWQKQWIQKSLQWFSPDKYCSLSFVR